MMTRKNKYDTSQRKIVLDILKKNRDIAMSVKDIIESEELENRVSKSSLYRILDYYIAEEKIRKFKDGNIQKYEIILDHSCLDHFHLKCKECKATIHLDVDFSKDLFKKILAEYKFEIYKANFLIEGICNNCKTLKTVR